MSDGALTGTGLIAVAQAAQAALDSGTPPGSSNEARFTALMIARAREVAARDRRLAPEIAAQEAAIATKFGASSDLNDVNTALRGGALDRSDALYTALYRLAVLRLRATKPEALAPEDRG